MLRCHHAVFHGGALSHLSVSTSVFLNCISTPKRTTSSSNTSSEIGKAYLPWNSRPWELTYLHHATEIDTLDENVRSIMCCQDRKALLKLAQSFGDTKFIEQYLEEAVLKLRQRKKGEAPKQQRKISQTSSKIAMSPSKRESIVTGEKSTKIAQKRNAPATYTQVV